MRVAVVMVGGSLGREISSVSPMSVSAVWSLGSAPRERCWRRMGGGLSLRV
jgi:hypothetical protein